MSVRNAAEVLLRLAGKIMLLGTSLDRVEDLQTTIRRMRDEVDVAEQQLKDLRGQA